MAVVARTLRQLKEHLVARLGLQVPKVVPPVAPDAPGQVHVFFLDGYAPGVDGAEVRVLEQPDNVRLGGFLKCVKRLRLETQLVIHVCRNASDKSLEAGPGQKHIYTLLVALDLSQGDRARLVSHLALFFDTTVGRGSLLDSLARLVDLHWHLGGGLRLRSNLGLGHFTVKMLLEEFGLFQIFKLYDDLR